MGVRSGPKIPTRGSEFERVTNGTNLVATTGWTALNSGTLSVSNGSLRVTPDSGGGTANSAARQDVPTVSGQSYTITLHDDPRASGNTAYTFVKIMGGGMSGTINTSATFSSATFYEHTFVATGSTTSILLYNGTATAGYYVDWSNISVKPVDSPLVLCLDAMNAKSFAGEPTTNLSANSNYSGAALNTISSSTNGGWGSSFDRWIAEIPGPGGNTVRAFHLKLTATTAHGHAEGAPYEISGMDSQYASLTAGSTYVSSMWAKVIRADGSNTPHTNSNIMYWVGQQSVSSATQTVNTEWTRLSIARTIASGQTGSYRFRHYMYSCNVGDILVITEPQIELKSYSTPYVLSSRATANSWKDLSGNGNHGTHSAADFGDSGDTVLYQKGQIMLPANVDDITSAPASINFDGTNDCVSWGDITLLDGLRRLTVSVWYKCEGASSSTSVVVFSKDNAVECWIEWSDAQTYTLSINNNHINFTNTTSPVGSWTHVVWTWESVGDVRKLYQNGNHIETLTTGSQSGNAINNVSNDLAVGARDSTSNGINGKIAAVQVYSAVLTHAQIKDMYNSQRSRFGL